MALTLLCQDDENMTTVYLWFLNSDFSVRSINYKIFFAFSEALKIAF